MKISLCMIVKDEEEVLARCLKSTRDLFDETVIVDTGSCDRTQEIALSFGAKVHSMPWNDDFAAARNYAFSLAAGDYLMWLDADDVITEENRERFKILKETIERELPDMVKCPYELVYDGNVVCRYFRERLVKRSQGFVWQGRVHECIAPRGSVIQSEFSVRHLGSQKPRGERNLKILRKWAQEETLSGRDLFYYGRELYDHGYYKEAEAVLENMLRGEGWYVNKIEACLVLSLTKTALNDPVGAHSALFTSLTFGEPRAKICNEIAKLYLQEKNLNQAEFWYRAALLCRDHTEEGDFEDAYARLLTPYLGLCRTAFEKGDMKASYEFHLKAEEEFPDHPSVLYNKQYFASHEH